MRMTKKNCWLIITSFYSKILSNMISLEFFEPQSILIPSFGIKLMVTDVYIYIFFVWLELTKKDTRTNLSTEHSGKKSSIFSLLALENIVNCRLLS